VQIAKLTAQSEANKEINDRKRLATSYANFESSRSPPPILLGEGEGFR
jgi:hypothetical protein